MVVIVLLISAAIFIIAGLASKDPFLLAAGIGFLLYSGLQDIYYALKDK